MPCVTEVIVLQAKPALLPLLFLLCSPRSFAGDLDDPAVPLVAVPAVARTIQLDGRLEAAEWVQGGGPSALVSVPGGVPVEPQPRVLVAFDAEALYVGARLPLAGGGRPVAGVTDHDGSLWEDDALEVFVDPGHSHATYYQFIVNSVGVRWDSRGRDSSWDGAWEAATGTEDDAWTAEIKIPFASLEAEAPADGTIWGLNVAWDRQTPTPVTASWAHMDGGLHSPESFGHALFASQAPSIRPLGPNPLNRGAVAFVGDWRSAVELTALLTLFERSPGGDRVELGSARTSHPGQASTRPLKLEVPLPRDGRWVQPGDYEATLTVTAGGKPAHVASLRFSRPAPLALSLRKYLLAGRVEAHVDASGLGLRPTQMRLSAALQARGGDQLQARAMPRPDAALHSEVVFDVTSLPAGDYEVVVGAADRRGEEIRTVTAGFTKPPAPQWLGATEGLTDEVLPPWTPVVADTNAARVWGREYEFGALPLPTRVVTAGASILAGPVTLEMVADGRPVSFEPEGQRRRISAQPNRAVLGRLARADGVECGGQVAVEYDGMIRSDLAIVPRGIKSISDLRLRIPIRAEHARYLYHFPGRWGSAYNAGALPPDGFTAGFRPFIWLGDEERGFAWFSESAQNVFVDDPDSITRISGEGDVVTLEIALIRGEHAVLGPLQYTFGFQATPVKPMDPSAWDYRICHHGGYGIQDRPWSGSVGLTYPAEGHILPQQGTFEAWVRPRFDPQPDVKPDEPGRGAYNRNLLDVELAGGGHIGFYWNIDDRGMRVYYKQGEQYPLILGSSAPLHKDRWHHVAFTWGESTRIYVDGEKVAERAHAGTVAAETGAGRIVLARGLSEFDLDEVAISSVARDGFDLTAPPGVDDGTLLLDRLDWDQTGPRHGATTPERGRPGEISGGEAVRGRFGTALGTTSGGISILDRLAQLGVRTICFHEHWTDIQNHTSTTYGDELHKLVAACHARGIKLLLYFGYEISNIAPEWDTYADECLTYPRAGGYHRQPEQNAYIVCYRSKWQDFMAHGIARMMDEYDIDGVYLDGTANPWPCANRRHGCGYEKPDGTLGEVYPIFDTREMMRRIYAIVKARKPDGQVNVHQSTCMTIPTLSWATSYWDGEQFGFMERGADPLTVLPLDAFRCEFMGHNWGVPAEFLCYDRPYTYDEALSFTLLHDVLVRASLDRPLELEARLWDEMERFGRREATWLPYWSQECVTAQPQSVKVSVYSRGSAGAVLVVSNLGAEAADVAASIDLAALELPAALTARDMLTDERIAISAGNRLAFPLGSFGFRVIHLSAEQ